QEMSTMPRDERSWRFWRKTDPKAPATAPLPETDQTVRAAVIGLGKLGILHAATLNALPGTRLVAVVDSAKTMLTAFDAAMSELRTYADYERMIDECRPDVVAIATPTGSHCEIASRCIDSGIATFIEKPLAANTSQIAPVLQSLSRRPVVNMVGYM